MSSPQEWVISNPSSPPTSCSTCSPVTEPLPALKLVLQNVSEEVRRNNAIAFRWNLKLGKLLNATRNGCAFCSFMFDRFFHRGRTWIYLYEPQTPWYCDPTESESKQKAVEHVSKIVDGLDADDFVFEVEPLYSTHHNRRDFNRLKIWFRGSDHVSEEELKPIQLPPFVTVDVFASKDNPAAEHISSRPPNATPASAESFLKAAEWISECLDSHSNCSLPATGKLPTRVIDVSGGDSLRLDVSGGQGQYLALSYCWGGPQTFVTTASTLADKIAGFNIGNLPRTLQDAVEVTQRLGFKYLWIDSMCIIQDSSEDKGYEVSRMADIYKRAYVTICAARAGDATEGFLQDQADSRTGLWKGLFPLSYPIPNKDATTITEAFEMPKHANGTLWLMEDEQNMYQMNRDPISRRAWGLQERILSPRLLYYGRSLFWQCNSAQHSHGGNESHIREVLGPVSGHISHAISKFVDAHTSQPVSIDLFRMHQLFQSWYQSVHDYSRRQLSVPEDKLPAIAGIAAEISRITGAGYVAGLWRNNLLHDLMWTTSPRERLNRPQVWRAPSWSWASVDSVISYGAITDDSTAEAKVLACTVRPSLEDAPFGEVRKGEIEISGPFAQVNHQDLIALLRDQGLAPSPPKSNDPVEWNHMIAKFITQKMAVKHVELDDDGTGLPEIAYCIITFSRVWSMHKGSEKKIDKSCYSGLLLAEVGPGQFERIGAFVNEGYEWLRLGVPSWSRRTIALI